MVGVAVIKTDGETLGPWVFTVGFPVVVFAVGCEVTTRVGDFVPVGLTVGVFVTVGCLVVGTREARVGDLVWTLGALVEGAFEVGV